MPLRSIAYQPRWPSIFLCAVLWSCVVDTAHGTLLFSETFDTDVPVTETGVEFTQAYPAFSFSGPGTVGVVDGVLQTTGNGMQVTIAGYESDVLIEGLVGAAQSPSDDYRVGLVIGQNTVVFQPGATTPPGRFQIEGPGGTGVLDMGFIPERGELHHVLISQHLDGLFEVTIIDGTDSRNVFSSSFRNLQSVGGTIGFHRGGPDNSGRAFYDDLFVFAVPEPRSVLLLLAGTFGLALRRRSLRGSNGTSRTSN